MVKCPFFVTLDRVLDENSEGERDSWFESWDHAEQARPVVGFQAQSLI